MKKIFFINIDNDFNINKGNISRFKIINIIVKFYFWLFFIILEMVILKRYRLRNSILLKRLLCVI